MLCRRWRTGSSATSICIGRVAERRQGDLDRLAIPADHVLVMSGGVRCAAEQLDLQRILGRGNQVRRRFIARLNEKSQRDRFVRSARAVDGEIPILQIFQREDLHPVLPVGDIKLKRLLPNTFDRLRGEGGQRACQPTPQRRPARLGLASPPAGSDPSFDVHFCPWATAWREIQGTSAAATGLRGRQSGEGYDQGHTLIVGDCIAGCADGLLCLNQFCSPG